MGPSTTSGVEGGVTLTVAGVIGGVGRPPTSILGVGVGVVTVTVGVDGIGGAQYSTSDRGNGCQGSATHS